MIKNYYHTSVLLQEAVDSLAVSSNKRFIDATMGGAGHTKEILQRGGKVLGIDQDEDALRFVSEQIKNPNLVVALGNFKDIDTIAKENTFEQVDGILFDLGVSSHQFDEGARGFSFQKEANLDMRMGTSLSVKAADLVNGLTKGELMELFTKLGEEPFAKRIAEEIIKAREIKPIETTTELAQIAIKGYPRGFHKIHPATKIFQALRIAVNDELNSLKIALPKAVELLKKNGRLSVISFHSLEDRIVKEFLNECEEKGLGTVVTKKPIVPTEEEIRENARSRSAKLRVFEKI
ncbi:MAG TPA: 16S rRNA (cytosine(1402)-N(4))-methyltransferase RsmH [Patescibacteria group bacterium]